MIKTFVLAGVLFIGTACVTGQKTGQVKSDLELFDELKLGMAASEVQEIVGKPNEVRQVDGTYWIFAKNDPNYGLLPMVSA